ncbi:hypothetical protein [Streptomyces sp. PsTaAH-124]|uniref:hypothetical protein n=1 Tax=Streptomyces sp. PsTaAH-124 TaxID=1157638 RepID=UPI000379D070|nr:hypothetical protein [Streptomyces sp. PsTaAH-124]EYT81534.1 hypothetical protein CF54_19015 [Streptomyces sp. Tu 6176]
MLHVAEPAAGESGEPAPPACDQRHTYACSGGHLHFVVQPVGKADRTRFGAVGPALQAAMGGAGCFASAAEVEAVCGRLREVLHG